MKDMKKDKQWYLAWSPDSAEYDHDDTILAVGLKYGGTRPHVIASWILWRWPCCMNTGGTLLLAEPLAPRSDFTKSLLRLLPFSPSPSPGCRYLRLVFIPCD